MTYVVLVIIMVIAGVMTLFLRRKASYYDQIFSDEHFVEVGNWLCSVLKLGPVSEPQEENNTAFQSCAACGFTFTRDIGKQDVIHIAISQVGNLTTHGVCSRLAFFILQILNDNAANTDFYYTESGIHHLLFAKDVGSEWVTNEVASALTEMPSYQAVRFRYQAVQN